MKKEEKGPVIDTLVEHLSNYAHVYITDIEALDAVATAKLRRLCFRSDVKLIVVKNTLLKKAMDRMDVDYSELYPVIAGSTSIMLSNLNNVPAKLIKEFRKTSPKPILKGAYVEETIYIGDENLEALVNIKSKDELVADVVAALQAPVKNVIGALQSGGATLSGVLKTLSEKPE